MSKAEWVRVPITQSPRYGLKKYGGMSILAMIDGDEMLDIRVEHEYGSETLLCVEAGPDAVVAKAILAAIKGAIDASEEGT